MVTTITVGLVLKAKRHLTLPPKNIAEQETQLNKDLLAKVLKQHEMKRVKAAKMKNQTKETRQTDVQNEATREQSLEVQNLSVNVDQTDNSIILDNALKESMVHSRKQSVPKPWGSKEGFTAESQRAIIQI